MHNATLEIWRAKGLPLVRDVVVKLSFTPEQRRRLEHEYSIYLRLSDTNAPGILRAFGLFEDVEGEALALVLCTTTFGHRIYSSMQKERFSSLTLTKLS